MKEQASKGQPERKSPAFDWLAVWILFSAWSSLSGWCLALSGLLNPVATSLSFALFFGGLFICRSHLTSAGKLTPLRILRSRYWVPKIWLGLTLLALIGGITHTPNNYDYLTYRFPRVLYWTWDHAWYWVPTINNRINYSGPGFEWLMASQFVLLKTDRFFFLINFVSYLFLPGLVFSVFSHLGISKRIAWWWMWVFPCGYCYILQAASTGNDSFAAVYLLASIRYLYRSKDAPSIKNLTLSSLAIALTTGAKASNLPLVLPWLTVLFFHRKGLLEKCRPVTAALILMVSAAVSFLPMALLNIHYTGDFAGDPANRGKMKISNPVIGLLGNSFLLTKDNLSPPIFPRPINWTPMVPSFLKAGLDRDFPRMYLHSGELQIEEDAGVGIGIVLFTGLFVVMGVRARVTGKRTVRPYYNQALWIVGAGVLAWLGYMTKMGSEATSRLIAAYYPLLIAAVLVPVALDGRTMKCRLLKGAGFLAILSAIPLVILSPSRPLFPVPAISNLMTIIHIPSEIIGRYNDVYGVYGGRANEFKDLVATFPPGEQTIGFLQGGNDSEVSLWRPFGARKLVEVTPNDSREKIQAQGIHYVLVSQDALVDAYHTTIASVADKWSAKIIQEKDIELMAHVGREPWYLLSL